jgi:hypothetical protein
MTAEPQEEAPAEEEQMLCPCCFHHNDPDITFCQDCGAPLGFIAFLGPLEQVYSEGFAYRRATTGPPSWIVLVGIWVIFFPPFLALGFVVVGFPFSQQWWTESPVGLLIILCGCAVSGAMIYQTTRNFVTKIRQLKAETRCIAAVERLNDLAENRKNG